MPYIGNQHNVGDHINNFKVLDDISSYTATFDGSATSVVDTTNNTIRVPQHRFIQGQRVTYTNGGGGNIGGLTTGTAYFVSFDSANTIKLATSLANANSNTVINLSSVGSGTSHTLNAAFDGINTKFKLSHGSGTPARLNNATQINVAINNVVQRPNLDPNNFTDGFALEDNHKIVFQTAPSNEDIFWGSIIANTIENFDLRDNEVDNFTGNGSATDFNLSTIPANNESVIVTIDGVLQHPSDKDTTRAYTLLANVIQFSAAPALNAEIQVRHIGFAGASTNDVSGFYGRTGNVALTANDHITTGDITSRNVNLSGILTASSAIFGGNVSIGGTLTYEDVSNIDSVGIITARDGIDCNGDIDVDGHTNLDNVNIAGVTTFTGVTNHNSTIQMLNSNAIRLLNGANSASTEIKCDGGARFNITSYNQTMAQFENGQSTIFYTNSGQNRLQITNDGIVLISKDLDVDGHTNLDNVSIAGFTTFPDATSTTGRLYFGNDQDMQLWHSGNDAVFYNNTGGFYIGGFGTGGITLQANTIRLRNGANNEEMIKCSANGAVELYHNDSKKLETTSVGVTVTGELRPVGNLVMNTSDNLKILFGASNDLQIFHDGSHSRIKDVGTGILSLSASQCNIQNAAVNENMAEFFENGAVNLYYDNVKRFETTNTGASVTGNFAVSGQTNLTGDVTLGGTRPRLNFYDSDGNPDFAFINDSGMFQIFDQTNGANRIQINSDGHVDILNHLDVNNGLDVTGNITATGTITSNDITIQDQQPRLNFVDNAGSPNDPDYLFQVDGGNFVLHDSTNGADKIKVYPDGHIDIFPNTDFAAGIDVTGNITATGDLDVDGHTNLDNVSIAGVTTAIGQLSIGAAPSSGLGLFNIKPSSGDEYFKVRDAGDFDAALNGIAVDIRNSANNTSKDFLVRSQDLVLWQSGAEKLRIKSNGRVGISTADPKRTLHVVDTVGGGIAVNGTTSGIQFGTVSMAGASYNAILSRAGSNDDHITGSTPGDLCLAPEREGAFILGLSPHLGAMTTGLRIDRLRNYDIYFNSQIKINTGSPASPSEKLRIDSGGRVLIGTTSSLSFNGAGGNHNLVVAGDSNDTDITDNYNAAITISNKDGTAMNTAGLHFAREDNDGNPHYDGASIVAQFRDAMNTGQYPKTDLAFLTSTSNNAAPSQKLRIMAGGQVNIGGSTQTSKTLYVDGTIEATSNLTCVNQIYLSGTAPQLVFTDTNQDSDYTIKNDGGQLTIIDRTNSNAVRMYANTGGFGGDRLYIANDIVHTGDTDTKIEFGTDIINFDTGGGERLRIDNDLVNIKGGNLHVGTDSATTNYTDSNAGNTRHIEIGATGGGDALLTTHCAGYGIGYFGYVSSGDRLVIACDQGGGNNSIDLITTAGTSNGGNTDNLNNKNPRFQIRGNGGFRAEYTDANEVHAISNYDHGNNVYDHRGGRTLTSNGSGWDGNQSTDGSDPILVLSVANRAGNSDIGDAYGIQLHSESQDDNDYGPIIGWSNRSNSGNYNTTYAAIVGQKTGQSIDHNWSSGALHFFTQKPGAYMTSTADMSINEDGYVTKPRQPAFNVTKSGGQINSNIGLVVFDDDSSFINCNIGNHYSKTGATQGRFTAPVAGRYQINARMLTNSSTQSYTILLLQKNGATVGYIGHNHSDYWLMESGSWVLDLVENDYVTVYLQQHSGHGGYNYASFSGFLIG